MSLFCCPICQNPLVRGEKSYTCPSGHCFDRAREGYVNLLPANRMHSKAPGDDKAMAAARSRFLSGGHYSHLRDLLCRLALAHTGEAPAVLDSGCGEGWYTAGLWEALRGRHPRMAGVDLSKPSLRWAAKRGAEAEFAVASAYRLPVGDGAADLLVNCFSPLALEEFRRVVKPGGVFLYVVPGADHLWQLKEVLYDTPYRNPVEDTQYEGFIHLGVEEVVRVMALEGAQTVADLFRMTPYYWKTPKAGAERLAALERLDVTAQFRVHCFRRLGR